MTPRHVSVDLGPTFDLERSPSRELGRAPSRELGRSSSRVLTGEEALWPEEPEDVLSDIEEWPDGQHDEANTPKPA